MAETRHLKISMVKIRDKNAYNYRLILPSSWMHDWGVTKSNRATMMSFDGQRIIIEKLPPEESRTDE